MDTETTLSPGERTLSTSLELEPFLNPLIATASELTGCETASMIELEEDGEVVNKTGESHYTEEELILPPVNPGQADTASRVFVT